MNPFKPTAGKMPPELIGRDFVVESFTDGVENGPGAPERLMRLTGVRGMGKTVMLSELGRIARDRDWLVIDEVASTGFCTRILDRLTPRSQVESMRSQPSILGISLGEIEIERASLTLREAMATRLKDSKTGLLVTLDEVQDSSLEEMRALAVAVQQVIGDDLSVAFVFAGLPSMIDRVVNAKALTFLRRAIPEELAPLYSEDVEQSFAETIVASGRAVASDALALMTDAAAGYPFMVQLVGYYTWQASHKRDSKRVELRDAEQGVALARRQFDRMVIEPALQNLSPTLLSYLFAMAEDEGRPSKTGAVAARLNRDLTELSSYRSRLIKENVVESRSRGEIEFVVPYMAQYLNEHRSELFAEMNE